MRSLLENKMGFQMLQPLVPVWDILVYVVLPLWILAGFADYCFHRAGDIEHANGAKESLLHCLMLAEVALPMELAIIFRVNALLLALMLVCLAAHEVTTHYDLKLAMATRKVTAFEQQVHGLLEVLPLTAILLLMIQHWQQTLALFGRGTEQPDFSLIPNPVPGLGLIIPFFGALIVLLLLPYLDEVLRGLRVEKNEGAKPGGRSESTDQRPTMLDHLPKMFHEGLYFRSQKHS